MVSSHASPPAERPKSLSMIHEDDVDFRPTVSPTASDEPKGRSLNFTMSELNNESNNVLSVNVTKDGMVKKKKIDLSDVDMDNDDEEDDLEMSLTVLPISHAKVLTLEATKNKTNGNSMKLLLEFVYISDFLVLECFLYHLGACVECQRRLLR